MSSRSGTPSSKPRGRNTSGSTVPPTENSARATPAKVRAKKDGGKDKTEVKTSYTTGGAREQSVNGRVTQAVFPATPTDASFLAHDMDVLPSDEVFDEGDRAQWMQLCEQAAITRRAQDMARPKAPADFDGKHCMECDILIPDLRLKLGCFRCVDCQTLHENDERLVKQRWAAV